VCDFAQLLPFLGKREHFFVEPGEKDCSTYTLQNKAAVEAIAFIFQGFKGIQSSKLVGNAPIHHQCSGEDFCIHSLLKK
jgi:hypothetical protein